MSIVIKVNNLQFNYRVLNRHQFSLKSLFKDLLKNKIEIENYHVLKNLSFTVEKGEILALIGKNGAGKSTLLKILSKILPPTAGDLVVTGTVAPMIELGAGFNPELTCRENILFYSALLGRDLKKVKPRVEHIASWAGVLDHLDYQLRTFSSGMIARLAFSIATDQVPDILIIDEVLSVGDGEFTKLSRDRMDQIMSTRATIVLVSHDLETVKKLATKVLWLENGAIKMFGMPETVIEKYQESQSV